MGRGEGGEEVEEGSSRGEGWQLRRGRRWEEVTGGEVVSEEVEEDLAARETEEEGGEMVKEEVGRGEVSSVAVEISSEGAGISSVVVGRGSEVAAVSLSSAKSMGEARPGEGGEVREAEARGWREQTRVVLPPVVEDVAVGWR